MMNPNTIPFSTCVAAYAGRVGIFLSAWAIVPVGMAIGKIAKGPMQLGHWSGAYHNGTEIIYGVPVESLKVAPGFWSNFDIPDETGITLYEATVAKIYRRFGWWAAVYYNMAFRNVGQGWLAKFKVTFPPHTEPPAAEEIHSTKFGIKFGTKVYRDWRSYPELGAFNGAHSWYGIPDLF